jgi:hypothetical protein
MASVNVVLPGKAIRNDPPVAGSAPFVIWVMLKSGSGGATAFRLVTDSLSVYLISQRYVASRLLLQPCEKEKGRKVITNRIVSTNFASKENVRCGAILCAMFMSL